MKTALIVDDEEDIGLMVSRLLEKEGLEVIYVDRVKQAKRCIDEVSFDFYLLDLNLPDGTGFDLIPIIRAKGKHARVVVISADDGAEETRRVKELGADAFIKKPFSKEDVVDVVEALS